jgi:hypothetical protein
MRDAHFWRMPGIESVLQAVDGAEARTRVTLPAKERKDSKKLRQQRKQGEPGMHFAQRISAYLRGEKLYYRLVISPRGGGYFFVNSPDLPGFSIMLQPGDIESLDRLAAAVVKPLEAFITAEYRSCVANGSRQVRVYDLRHRPNSSEIQAQWCTA